MLQTKLILSRDTTVHEIVQLLDKTGVGVLPIVNDKGELIGIVTDGDIRRAVLNNSLSIDNIINKNPKRAHQHTPKSEIIRMLRQLHYRHMPIVDEKNVLVDMVFLENLLITPRINKVVIMAGGLGTRLGQLTKTTPKPMLPVNGRPILVHIVEHLKNQGFNDFVFCLNYKAESIMEYFGSGERLGVNITYTIEQTRLGTAGALSLIDRDRIRDPFIVLNADIITNLDFDDLLSFHLTHQSLATMCVKLQAYEIPFACVEFDEQYNLQSLVEKPKVNNYINAGIYVLDPLILDLVPAQSYYDMPSLFQDAVANQLATKVYHFENYWMDIGQVEDYHQARRTFDVGE